MLEQHVIVGAAPGGTSLKYFTYTSLVQSKPRGRGPSEGHQINQRDREIIHGRGKKKKGSDTPICLHFISFSRFSNVFLVKY